MLNATRSKRENERGVSEGPRAQNRVQFFSARARALMLGGVAALIARLGMRREVALYCELNAPLMSRRIGLAQRAAFPGVFSRPGDFAQEPARS